MNALRLLMATDGSDGALHAAQWIVEHFDIRSAKLTVVAVIPTSIDMGSPTFSTVPAYAASLDDASHHRAMQACHKTVALADALEPDAHILQGNTIAGTILAFVDDHPVDAIVVGRRRSAIGHMLGSVSQELVNQSPVPVWVVPHSHR